MEVFRVGIVFGYLTSFLWCIRWIPTLVFHIRHRRYMPVNHSFLCIEAGACICGLIYGYLDKLHTYINN